VRVPVEPRTWAPGEGAFLEQQVTQYLERQTDPTQIVTFPLPS
jgi:hypothetical protein